MQVIRKEAVAAIEPSENAGDLGFAARRYCRAQHPLDPAEHRRCGLPFGLRSRRPRHQPQCQRFQPLERIPHRAPRIFFIVMAGLDPAIPRELHWDPRVKPGDDVQN